MKTLLVLLLLLLPSLGAAQEGVLGSKHNLSFSGPGIKSLEETQICKFCHYGHSGGALAPSNRAPSPTYQPYESSTLVAPSPGGLAGASRACLACHDGTIAIGEAVSPGKPPSGLGNVNLSGTDALGTDLHRSHPISFQLISGLELHAPPIADAVRLRGNGRVECASCHDPHSETNDPLEGKFLVESNRGSAICIACHAPEGWLTNPSSHQSSLRPYNAALGSATRYATVGDNGCGSCHRPHAAAPGTVLLKTAGSALCLECHGGRVAQLDLRNDLMKPYAHPVLSTDAVHDPAEGSFNKPSTLPERNPQALRHASCVDCHDPHAAFSRSAIAPFLSGSTLGSWGIDAMGSRVEHARYEYELCFKCHGDSANQPQARGPTPPERLQRAVTDVNLRQAFDANSAISFHPVEAPGRGTDVPSLLLPWSVSSIIYCGDCHASDSLVAGGAGTARGPHGSIYPHILERNLSTGDLTAESPSAYALCYKCHDRGILLSGSSAFKEHDKHVRGDNAPCTSCHSSHGVSSRQGNSLANAHLIDFDVSIVSPNARGLRAYSSLGRRMGRCSLSCHGKDHDNLAY